MKRRLLWIGDAACESGFARCTHHTIPGLQRAGWDVSVLGLNYRGDPHPQYQYDIYPCWPGGDLFGVKRLNEIMAIVKPHMIVIQNDPWNIPSYLRELAGTENPPPVVGAIAVDGKNCRGRDLNGLATAIFWTQFGQREAIKGGFFGPSAVVPLGVDQSIYTPGDRRAARHAMGFQGAVLDGFIVGNVNRNQPRKRLDLTIAYFADWVKRYAIDNAYLFLHVAPTGDKGIDCKQFAAYHGLYGRVILAEPEPYHGLTEEMLANVYRSFSVMCTTSQAEGWGLPAMEGMACGVPQILPNHSAYTEWPGSAAVLVDVNDEPAVTPNKVNVIGATPSRERTIDALNMLYNSEEVWKHYRDAGLELVSAQKYRWDVIADEFAAVVGKTYVLRGGVL
jgi:D-inositol-3-phosphate glycosyltransferase